MHDSHTHTSMGSDKTDEQITLAVQNGESEAFGTLIKRYEDKMLRYARRFLFNSEDSRDLVQDVFIKAYVNINSFDVTRRFSPWLYRIAHNEFINAINKRRTLPLLSFDFDTLLPHPIAKETADQGLNEKELKQVLERGLDKIDVKYREPLVLYYFEELNYTEIAEILKIPVSTVGVRLSRGKALLQTQIKNDEL